MRLAYQEAIGAGYAQEEVLAALPWFSSTAVQQLYTTHFRRATERGATAAALETQYNQTDLKRIERLENKHRNAQEPYKLSDQAAQRVPEVKDYVPLAR